MWCSNERHFGATHAQKADYLSGNVDGVNIGDLALQRLETAASSQGSDRDAWVDIEVAEGLVARLRPTGQPSTYKICVGILVDGYLLDQSAPFEASFGPEFDNAMAALRRSPSAPLE